MKNHHAVALSKLGNRKGGLARAASMTPEQRVAISRKAALARWAAAGKKKQRDDDLKIKSAKVVETFKISIGLSNGKKIVRDFSNFVLTARGILRQLRDPVFFSRVKVVNGTLTWPGEIDFCPDTLIWGIRQKKQITVSETIIF